MHHICKEFLLWPTTPQISLASNHSKANIYLHYWQGSKGKHVCTFNILAHCSVYTNYIVTNAPVYFVHFSFMQNKTVTFNQLTNEKYVIRILLLNPLSALTKPFLCGKSCVLLLTCGYNSIQNMEQLKDNNDGT